MYLWVKIYKIHSNHESKAKDTKKKKERKKENQAYYFLKNHHILQEKQNEEIRTNNLKTSNKVAINTYLSIIALNINGINAPIKRNMVADQIRKHIFYYTTFKRLTSKLKIQTD